MNDIFSFDMDVDVLHQKIKSTITELNQLEESSVNVKEGMASLSKEASKVSFNKPIADMNELKSLIKTTFSKDSINMKGFDEQVNLFLRDGEKMKTFLNSLKSQLKNLDGKELQKLQNAINVTERELEKLEKQSQGTRKEFVNLKKSTGDLTDDQLRQAGKLKDAIGDQQQQIRILASDTKALDFGIETVSLAANGYQLLTGSMQLFGVENEDVMQAMVKLQSIMAITNGLREIQNALLAEGTLRTIANDFATKAAATAQGLYTAAVTGSTAAMTTFRTALLATGIGAIIVLLGYATSKFIEYQSAVKNTAVEYKNLNDLTRESVAESSKEITKLAVYKKAIEDGNLPLEKRLNAIKSIKKEFPEYFSGLSNEALLAGKVGDAYDKVTSALLRKARANVAQKEIEKIQEPLLHIEISRQSREASTGKGKFDINTDSSGLTPGQATAIRKQAKAQSDLIIQSENEKYNELLKQQEIYLNFVVSNSDFEIKEEKKKQEKKSKVATEGQKKEVDQYKLHTDELIRILLESNNEIDKLTAENVKATIDSLTLNIDQQIDRARLESKIQLNALGLAYQNQVNQLEFFLKNSVQNATESEEIRENLNRLNVAYSDTVKRINSETDLKVAILEYDKFNSIIKELQDNAKQLGISIDIQQFNELVQLNQLYNRGAISYEEFERKKTETNKKYTKIKLQQTIAALDTELATINSKLLAGGLSSEQTKELENRKREIRRQIGQSTTDLTNPDPQTNGKQDAYTNFFGSILETGINTYNQLAEAEQRSAERSISIQERRLERAQRLAERGNAEYVELEEQRLTALQQKQEAAARRQIQINEAIQVSQLLTAVTGAAAQIKEGGTANVLAALATIFATIGSAAVLISQNQSSQPSFYKGVDAFLGSDKLPGSTTTAHQVTLHGQETVVQNHDGTADTYRPTLKAIRRNLVPAGLFNAISQSYLSGNKLNYGLVSEATQSHQERKSIIINFANLEGKMDAMAEALGRIAMKVNMDKDGISAMLETHMNQIELQRNG